MESDSEYVSRLTSAIEKAKISAANAEAAFDRLEDIDRQILSRLRPPQTEPRRSLG